MHTQGSFGSQTRRHDQLYPDEDERGDTKGVYEITLKCGSKIVLDLAGAQWDLLDDEGSHAPVLYWSDYWQRWGAAIKYRLPFRSHQLKHSAKMNNYRMITSQTLIMEIGMYLNMLIVGSCKADLGFYPRDLLDMESKTARDAKQRFFDTVLECLQKRPNELDSGKSPEVLNALGTFDLRHPKIIAEVPAVRPKSNGSLPLNIGNMEDFDWKEMSRLIRMPGPEVTFKEKKRAKALQKKRSVFKEHGDWRMVFLDDTIPASRVPVECVSENVAWKLRV